MTMEEMVGQFIPMITEFCEEGVPCEEAIREWLESMPEEEPEETFKTGGVVKINPPVLEQKLKDPLLNKIQFLNTGKSYLSYIRNFLEKLSS